MKKLLFAGVAALSLLLAGAAVAGSCIEYCGTLVPGAVSVMKTTQQQAHQQNEHLL